LVKAAFASATVPARNTGLLLAQHSLDSLHEWIGWRGPHRLSAASHPRILWPRILELLNELINGLLVGCSWRRRVCPGEIRGGSLSRRNACLKRKEFLDLLRGVAEKPEALEIGLLL